MKCSAWFACVVCLLISALAMRAELSPDKYIVVFDGDSSAKVFLRAKSSHQPKAAAVNAAKQRAAAIKAQHDSVSAQLKSIGAKEVTRHHKLVNAMTVKATEAQAAAMRKLPGVKAVQRVRIETMNTASSVPFIGAPAVWGGLTNVDGNGIRIGIIDTGIDYTHADFGGSGNPDDYVFNDSTYIEPGSFPTAKVVGGYDFAGNTFDAGDANSNVPIPDPDPLDCEGHGSHVAGIAAGFGVLTNGTTFSGPYSTLTNFTQFGIGPGVAPRALLFALKVFGCSGSTDDSAEIPALEFAADPNNDDDFSDHLDAINMSLGSKYGFADSGVPVEEAINTLADLGCVPAISAGNDYDSFYIVGSPGTTPKAITVACSIDNGTTTAAVRIKSPASIAGSYVALEGSITVPLTSSGPREAQLVYVSPSDACSTINNASSLTGNIALIDRGSCNFQPKILNAQAAGAIAVVMVNSSGAPIVMGGSSDGIDIPGVMISSSDGALLKQHLGEGIIAHLGVDTFTVHPELTDQISDFSSRGPSAPVSKLKPDIAAPGYLIDSVKCGGGTVAANLSGTSMAAPHMAGAAALMRQLHPDWSVEDIKAVLMETAVATHDASGHPYAESRTGAGRVNLANAARAAITATAENSDGAVSMSFGALTLTNVYSETRNIILTNHSASAIAYSIVASNTVTENGCSLTPLVTNVTVPAFSSAIVPVQLTANPNLFDRTGDPATTSTQAGAPRQLLYEFSGQVWFQNTNLSIHLPFYANVRSGADFKTGITHKVIVATNQPVNINIPISGFSTHPQPLVSAFQLGYVSTNSLDPENAMTDLLAVGAASDFSQFGSISSSTLFFAAATAGNWPGPNYAHAEIAYEIDFNFDGVYDAYIFNDSLANNGGPSDVYETGLNDSVYSYLNWFSAAQRDTAPFNNSVSVLAIPCNLVGLGNNLTAFNYRAVTGDWYGIGETTPWIKFDAAKPAIDTPLYGISGKPFFTDGTTIQVRANPGLAAANGLSPSHLGLMLLHHMNNTVSNRLELIDLQFAPQFLRSQLQGDSLVLNWSSVSNASYTLQYATNLNQGFTFVQASGIVATPPVNSFSVNAPPGPARYYRLVQQ